MRSVVTATAKGGKTQTKLILPEVRRTKTLDFELLFFKADYTVECRFNELSGQHQKVR